MSDFMFACLNFLATSLTRLDFHVMELALASFQTSTEAHKRTQHSLFDSHTLALTQQSRPLCKHIS